MYGQTYEINAETGQTVRRDLTTFQEAQRGAARVAGAQRQLDRVAKVAARQTDLQALRNADLPTLRVLLARLLA